MGSCASQIIRFDKKQLKLLHNHQLDVPEGVYLLSSVNDDNELYAAIQTKNNHIKYHSKRIVQSEAEVNIKIDGWARNFSIYKWYKKNLNDINKQHRTLKQPFSIFEYDNLVKQIVKGYHEMLVKELKENNNQNQNGELCIKMSNIRVQEIFVANHKHSYQVHLLPPIFSKYKPPTNPNYGRINGKQISILGLLFLDLGLLQPINILNDQILKGYLGVIELRYPGKARIIHKLIHGAQWNEILEDLGLNMKVKIIDRQEGKTVAPFSPCDKNFTDPIIERIKECETMNESSPFSKQIPLTTIIQEHQSPIATRRVTFDHTRNQKRSKSANFNRNRNNSYSIVISPPPKTNINHQQLNRSRSITTSKIMTPVSYDRKYEIVHKPQLEVQQVKQPVASISHIVQMNDHRSSRTRNIIDGYIPIYSNRGLHPQTSIRVIQQPQEVFKNESKNLNKIKSYPIISSQYILAPSEKCVQRTKNAIQQQRVVQIAQPYQNPQMTFQQNPSQPILVSDKYLVHNLFTRSRGDYPLHRNQAELFKKQYPSTKPDIKEKYPIIQLQTTKSNMKRLKGHKSAGRIYRRPDSKLYQYPFDEQRKLFQKDYKWNIDQQSHWRTKLQQSFDSYQKKLSRDKCEVEEFKMMRPTQWYLRSQQQSQQWKKYSNMSERKMSKHKYSCIKDNRGNQFRGQITQDKSYGKGQIWNSNGFKIYQGQIRYGQYHGIGVQYNQENMKRHLRNISIDDWKDFEKYWIEYRGQFKQGKWHGKGTLTMMNKQKYEGTFYKGKPEHKNFWKLI